MPPPPLRPLARAPQLTLGLVPQLGWGGERPGAGRKAIGPRPISHRRELAVREATPVHVTLRMGEDVTNLRTPPCYAVIAAALRRALHRAGFRVVHFSIQTTHVHLIAEASSPRALANGMRFLSGRMAAGINRLTNRTGPVFAQDRYHAHVLRTPTEVAHAVAYVVGNFASHARRRGEYVPPGFVDPYSSAAEYGPDGCRPPVAEPRSWLLRTHGSAVRESEAEYAAAG